MNGVVLEPEVKRRQRALIQRRKLLKSLVMWEWDKKDENAEQLGIALNNPADPKRKVRPPKVRQSLMELKCTESSTPFRSGLHHPFNRTYNNADVLSWTGRAEEGKAGGRTSGKCRWSCSGWKCF